MTRAGTDLCYLTIRDAASLLRRRELSPVELTRAHLERIEQVDKQVQAYVTLLPEEALAEARAAEAAIGRGQYRGPLHGIPVAHKDLYDTRGVRTTAQSKLLEDRVPEEDATAVARLKEAGTVLLGKLALHEFAIGGPYTSLFQPARNPWNPAYVPGGSSSGSGAAIAAGLCMGSLGSDTGGSIRQPASLCGVVGLQPTYGRVSRFGMVPLSWGLDYAGPLTRTVEDAALVLQVIAGHDPRDPATSGAPVQDYSSALREDVRGMTLGLPREFFTASREVDAEYVDIVEKAVGVLQELGARVEDVALPSLEYIRASHWAIMRAEGFAYHRENLRSRFHDYGENVRMQLSIGAIYTAADYVQAQRARTQITREFRRVLQHVDLLVTPTTANPAGKFANIDPRAQLRRPSLTAPFNLTGMPAISVPCGFTAAGLPVGLQIAGKPFDEPTVFRAAYAYQQAARWTERHPAL
ncbi:MAG: Asp-tRNA(Asn)/Glu-tRNA(Gln) amidotransferase subunit GatA [Chloroflexi bacterium]|nr:Asp-tRNA(Asn)/Glu-tRNA(Gln) amidotransferase subunit GatA [Chloroflexota bacterium]